MPFELPAVGKRVPSELSKVKKLIESGAPVIASLSSSYMGFCRIKRGQVKSALKSWDLRMFVMRRRAPRWRRKSMSVY
ncbi:MAG: hypothetical protein ACLR3S_02445 [Clostridium fessum]